MPPMTVDSDAAQLQVHTEEGGDIVRFTVEGMRQPAVLLYCIGAVVGTWPHYRARWTLDPKTLRPQVVVNIATAVGLYVLDRMRSEQR